MSDLHFGWGRAVRLLLLVSVAGVLVGMLFHPYLSEGWTGILDGILPGGATYLTYGVWAAILLLSAWSVWLSIQARSVRSRLRNARDRAIGKGRSHGPLLEQLRVTVVDPDNPEAARRVVSIIGAKTLHECRTVSEHLPLLGLLGTVLGIHFAFGGQAVGSTEAVASGIATALRTTAAGLIGMLPASLSARALERSMDLTVTELEGSLEQRRDSAGRGSEIQTNGLSRPRRHEEDPPPASRAPSQRVAASGSSGEHGSRPTTPSGGILLHANGGDDNGLE